MGRQEINIIVTVKSLEELVFQVAPVAKSKLEKISSMKPGKMVLKSHVECDACQSDMEVNFFWCHALSVSAGDNPDDCVASVKDTNDENLASDDLEVQKIVKAEPLDDDDFEYEEEYLIEDLENDQEQNFLMKTEENETLEQVLIEDDEESQEEIVVRITEMVSPTPKLTKRALNDQKFEVPDNDVVQKLDLTGICDFCDYRRKRLGATLSRNTFMIHCATHLIQKNGMIYSCNACGLPSETLNTARVHSLTCDQRENYKNIWKNRDVEAFAIPEIVEASDPNLKTSAKKYPRAKVLCHICSKYVHKQTLKDHMIKHELGSRFPYECDACGKHFSSRDNVRKHLIVRHFPKLAKFHCSMCPAVFAQKHFYDTHIMSKHKMGDVEKVTCMVCGIVVANERNLKEHNFNAHVDPLMKQKFSCKLCSKVFYDKRHLKAHMMVHLPEEEKPYKCEKCGKRFVNGYKYKQHMLEHENPDLILRKCEICGKGYKYSNSLKVHMRVHTGEQPYECKFCNRRFADRSHHRVHMKGHESEMGIKLTLTAEERRLVNHGVFQPEELISQVVIE